MNFSFLSGGFLLIAIAAVWLFIFIPGMSERSEIRNRPSSVTRSKKQNSKTRFRTARANTSRKPNRVSQSEIAAAISAVTAETLINTGLQASAPVVKVNDRAWTPTAIPSQLFQSQVGTLESAQLAEVIKISDSATRRDAINTEIEQISTETASINLDEILRRRRANG